MGLNLAEYESFELDQHRYPGRAIATGKILEISRAELEASREYRDKRIVPADALGGLVVGPITVPEHSPDRRDLVGVSGAIGAVCLYPREDGRLAKLHGWLAENGTFLARLYLAALERYTIGLRRSFVERVAFRKDLASLEHNFLRQVREELAAQAAQLWIADPAQRRIYLHRAINVGSPKIHDVQPLPYTDDNPVTECFSSGRTLVHSPSRPICPVERFPDGPGESLSNAMLVALPLPESAVIRGDSLRSAGVLVLFNHHAIVGQRRHLAVATWEEKFIAEFVCEMLAVVIFQILKSRDHESDFGRLMHGIRKGLHTPLKNLKAVEETSIDLYLPTTHQNYISDAVFWLEDFTLQINHNEFVGGHLDLAPVGLFHEVLVRVGTQTRRIVPRPPAQRAVVHGLDDNRSARVFPRVLGNVAALTGVFRNLIDNSIKYAPRVEGFVPEIWFEFGLRDDHHVTVTVSDNGIGIPEEDRSLIFEDGYRSPTARAHVPDGIGRGLYDCRRMLEMMHGGIDVLPPERGVGARFEITLQVAHNRALKR